MLEPNRAREVAQDIKRTVKAKYDENAWLEVARPLADTLRKNQRDALVAYLLPHLGFKDANRLYQHLLIDVEMDPCMETSRIKQAISSVQLFVQRCLMHLEEIPPFQINASQWEWMKSYRVWEANRKVFLYPENWIEPELRDDKTPFFKELEAALQQDEVTSENVEAALLQYLTKLEGVANLEICGLYWDEPGDVVHVFGRTYNSPHEYFYRRLEHQTVWKAWEKVSVDIESAEDGGHRGAHLAPVVWNRRLYLFWPVFGEQASPADNPPQSGTGKSAETKLQVKLAWSEYSQGKWQPKQVSQESVTFPKDYLTVRPARPTIIQRSSPSKRFRSGPTCTSACTSN